jgi:hypothetical protein
MIISGALSTMNVWVDKWDDIRFSINDVYMTLLMTGWMFLLMGLYYRETKIALIGLLCVCVNIWCIRTQFMVDTKQYVSGMIPHHSMAILMSKQLLKTDLSIKDFLLDIITTQEKEIEYMKKIESQTPTNLP